MGFQKLVLEGHVLGWCPWGKALRLKALSRLLRRRWEGSLPSVGST